MDFDAGLEQHLAATKPLHQVDEDNKGEVVYLNDQYKNVISSLMPARNRDIQDAHSGFAFMPKRPTPEQLRNAEVLVPVWTVSRHNMPPGTQKTVTLMRKTAPTKINVKGKEKDATRVMLDADAMLTHLLNLCLEVVLQVMGLYTKFDLGMKLLVEGSVYDLWHLLFGLKNFAERVEAIKLHWLAVLGLVYLGLTGLLVSLWLLGALWMTRKIIKYDKLVDGNFTEDPDNWVLISPRVSRVWNKFLRCIGFQEVRDCTEGCQSIVGVYFRRLCPCSCSGHNVLAEDGILKDEGTLRGFWLWCSLMFCVMFNVATELRDMLSRLHCQKVEAVVYACYNDIEDGRGEIKRHRIHEYIFVGSKKEYDFQNRGALGVLTPLTCVNGLCIIINVILLYCGPQQPDGATAASSTSLSAVMSLLFSIYSLKDQVKIRCAFSQARREIEQAHVDILNNPDSGDLEIRKSLRVLDIYFDSCRALRKKYEKELSDPSEAKRIRALEILNKLSDIGIGSAPAPTSAQVAPPGGGGAAAAPAAATRGSCLCWPCLHASARTPATSAQVGPAADHDGPLRDLEDPAGPHQGAVQHDRAQAATASAFSELGATSTTPLLASPAADHGRLHGLEDQGAVQHDRAQAATASAFSELGATSTTPLLA